MAAKFTLRPGVFFTWIDAGLSPTSISTSIGAMVFPSDRGSLEPKLSTGYANFVNSYGPNKFERGFGHDTAKAFFRTAEASMTLRVTGTGAKYAGGVLANDYVTATVTAANPSGLKRESSTFIALPDGSDDDITVINRDVVDIIFAETDIGPNMSLALTVNGVAITTVPFNATHNNTMDAIATGLQGGLNAVGAGGYAVAIVRKNASSSSKRVIRIIGPQNANLVITAPTWTGSAAGSAPAVTIRDTEWLTFTLAENPGAWGSNVAIKYDGIDPGRMAKSKILFAGPMATNHNFSYTINGISATVAPNASGSNVMLDDIVTSINATIPGIKAAVTPVVGSNLNREIILLGNTNKVDINIAVAQSGFGSGSTPALPAVTFGAVVTRIDTGDNFTTSLYEYPDLRNAKEAWRGTYQQQLDATGNQINLEYLVNKGPNRSTRIRVYTNPSAIQNGWTLFKETTIDTFTKEGFLQGGANGALPTSANMINGWDKFRDSVKYTIRILMDSGYSTPEVHRNMNLICEERRDSFAIFGVPQQYQATPESAVDYRQNVLAVDSSYCALYSSDVEIFDNESGTSRWSPISGYVGAVFAFTDRTRREFWSPAGLVRGRIPEASAVRLNPDNGGQGLLPQYQVNAILNYKGRGVYVFNDFTLQYANSPFQFIGTRRMCNSIEIIASDTVAYRLFDPNNRAARTEIVRILESVCQDYQDGGGINNDDGDGYSIKDETTKADIDARQSRFAMAIKPTTSMHQIHITGIVVNQVTSFQEVFQTRQGNGVSSSVSV